MEFAELVETATAGAYGPYPYQRRLAERGLPDVLRVPTGAGKTLAAVLPWAYRRSDHPDVTVRESTPRWLVVVLPQRTLVEQTAAVVEGWLTNLNRDIPLHLLMGGEDSRDREWKTHPERERVFVGTQDMVLSRLLMRGFAESRNSWPMSFGLLHAGVQFVFDEVQLMGPGLPTSLQLQGLRELLGTAVPCRSMWMSATVDLEHLSTVDFRRELSVVELSDEDRRGQLRVRLQAPRTVRRLDLGEVASARYPRALADRVLAEHRPGTRTIVVLNTVERARSVYDALVETVSEPSIVLLHSRFRPADRRRHTDHALADPGRAGTVVVSTQVLEAGVDLTSDTLVTEVAPWSSIVQRAGRCNRDGLAEDARLLWATPQGRDSHLPYDPAELDETVRVLEDLEGSTVTSTDLTAATPDALPPVHPVLRRRDLLDLFDTAPDLSGNDIDVSPFIRDDGNRTVSVAWREHLDSETDTETDTAPLPAREEICPGPITAVRELITSGRTRARIFDQSVGHWRAAVAADVRPTAVLVLDAARGGYLPARGFDPASSTLVHPVSQPAALPATLPDAVDTDTHSVRSSWVSLTDHSDDAERAAAELITALRQLPGVTAAQQDAVRIASRYHDLGKAHPTFITALEKANADHPAPGAGLAWAKSPSRVPLRYEPAHFRHELVSALLLLDPTSGLLDGVEEADLVVHLALAHHGKVRVTVRARPDEARDTVLGVTDGSSTVDITLPGGRLLPARTLSLEPVRLGEGSLTSRALRLRDRRDLGPFRLAFCEALVRGADWLASAKSDGSAA